MSSVIRFGWFAKLLRWFAKWPWRFALTLEDSFDALIQSHDTQLFPPLTRGDGQRKIALSFLICTWKPLNWIDFSMGFESIWVICGVIEMVWGERTCSRNRWMEWIQSAWKIPPFIGFDEWNKQCNSVLNPLPVVVRRALRPHWGSTSCLSLWQIDIWWTTSDGRHARQRLKRARSMEYCIGEIPMIQELYRPSLTSRLQAGWALQSTTEEITENPLSPMREFCHQSIHLWLQPSLTFTGSKTRKRSMERSHHHIAWFGVISMEYCLMLHRSIHITRRRGDENDSDILSFVKSKTTPWCLHLYLRKCWNSVSYSTLYISSPLSERGQWKAL